MICNKCGNEYRDDFDFCINCGEPNPLKAQEPAPKVQPEVAPSEPISKEDLERNMTVWSVIAFVIAICGPFIIDLIFASIANARITTFRETYGALREALKTNERLAKAARIIGIVKIVSFAVFFVVYFVINFIIFLGMAYDEGLLY